MSTITIRDIAHLRSRAPDLEAIKAFLTDFGLTVLPSEGGVLYARGTGQQPFVHSTSPGEPGFLALGLQTGSIADLEVLAAGEGALVEPMQGPEGGSVVRLSDSDRDLLGVQWRPNHPMMAEAQQ